MISCLFLGEDFANFHAVQGAAVTDLAVLSILNDLANPGGGGVFKLGGDRGDIFNKEAQDVILVSDDTGGQVADQTVVALGGFGSGKDSKSSIIVLFDGTTSTTSRRSQDQSLEEDNTAQETHRGGQRGGGGGGGGGSGSCAKVDHSGISKVGESHQSKSSNDVSVHVDKVEV